jgi:DNA mismatch endonuclease (patch repair protein)
MHKAGLRFRLHDRKLPGCPDLVLRKHHTAVFVHGCFWHRHPGCPLTTTPGVNQEFWERKFDSNVRRDHRNTELLEAAGWRVVCIWACELRYPSKLDKRIAMLVPVKASMLEANSELK